jgi:hypothetical protein
MSVGTMSSPNRSFCRQNTKDEDNFSPSWRQARWDQGPACPHHLSPLFEVRGSGAMRAVVSRPLKTKPGILGRSRFLLQVGQSLGDGHIYTLRSVKRLCRQRMTMCRELACCWAVQKVSLPVQALAPATHRDDCTPEIYIYPV